MKPLLDFLYPVTKAGYACPQFCLASLDKKCLAWYPGKKASKPISLDNKLIGLTGRVYQTYDIPHDRQPFLLSWLAIDLDDLTDKKGWLDFIIEATKGQASVRTSQSGKGVHIIFRCNPVLFPVGYKVAPFIKGNLEYFVSRLQEGDPEFFSVCRYDGQMFYLHGGKNEWLYQSQEFITLRSIKSKPSFHINNIEKEENGLPPLNNKGIKFLGILKERLPSFRLCPEQGVYIKELYQALKGSEFEFKTCSPMLSEQWHVNGNLKIKGFDLELYASADNRVIKQYPFFIGD